jgi:hypothetical protein
MVATAGSIMLFDDWFDPIEDAVRERVRGVIETIMEEELDATLSRPRYGRRRSIDDAAPIVGSRHGLGSGEDHIFETSKKIADALYPSNTFLLPQELIRGVHHFEGGSFRHLSRPYDQTPRFELMAVCSTLDIRGASHSTCEETLAP